MEIEKVRLFDGKKFAWDGEEHASEEEAKRIEEGYREKGFEVQRLVAGTTVLLYTRRLVSATAS